MISYAPGRVNLIGEHTDYNDGFVLPMAIDRGVRVEMRARGDRRLVARSSQFGSAESVDLDRLKDVDRSSWFAYVAGVAWALRDGDQSVSGADVIIDSDLPTGAGLSSSAALELAVARAFAALSDEPWQPVRMARLCQRAENEFVGVPCGIMDQFCVAASEEGSALLLDCRSLVATPVALPADAAVVVIDTGVRRRLASGEYAERRSACSRATAVLHARNADIAALRDASLAELDAARAELGDVTYRRARHVVEENDRVLAFVDALRRGDLSAAGALLNASHESLSTLFEVSGPELDRLVATAQAHPACHGARMTGAGFGGCAVALVRSDAADIFSRDLDAAAAAGGGSAFIVRASGGARIVNQETES